MRKLSASALLVAVAFLSLLACRKAARPAGLAGFSGDETVGLFQKGSEVVASPREVAPEQGKGTRGEDAPAALGAARKLIQNAEVSIEVRDFDTAAQKAGEIARSLGGYVADSQAAGEGKRRHGALTVRVPAGSFEKALGGLRHLGKVQSEHLGVQDITKAYTDLESRLMVKRDAAGRIREILRNRTAKLSDVLEAEKQLTELVEQIEVMEGERRFYDQQVALSTIKAELHEPEAIARPSALEPLREALRDSLFNLSSSLAAFVTGILYVAPWALLVIVLLVLLRRARRRRQG